MGGDRPRPPVIESERPHRRDTGDLRRETDDLALTLARANAELLVQAEQRFALRMQAEIQAAKSAELTMAETRAVKAERSRIEAESSRALAEKRARRTGAVAIASSVSSIVMLAITMLIVRYLRDLLGDDIREETASAFEQRTDAVEEDVGHVKERVDNIEKSVKQIDENVNDINESIVALVKQLKTEDEPPPKKTRGKQR